MLYFLKYDLICQAICISLFFHYRYKFNVFCEFFPLWGLVGMIPRKKGMKQNVLHKEKPYFLLIVGKRLLKNITIICNPISMSVKSFTRYLTSPEKICFLR